MDSSGMYRALSSAVVLLIVGTAAAQDRSSPEKYEPVLDQEGKDVVWHPTDDVLVEAMLDVAKVKSKDRVIDLGSGDGRIVIAAAKRGARAMGVEFNRDLVSLSKRRAELAGVSGKTSFVAGDLFETDLSKATVITMFLRPDLNVRLRPKILRLRPGTRVVSNSFDMERWKPDETVSLDDCELFCTAYFWIVPARVEGVWETVFGQFRLEQEFQMVTGTYTDESGPHRIWDGMLRGNELTFRTGGAKYSGFVSRNSIRGTVDRSGETRSWVVRRTTQ